MREGITDERSWEVEDGRLGRRTSVVQLLYAN